MKFDIASIKISIGGRIDRLGAITISKACFGMFDIDVRCACNDGENKAAQWLLMSRQLFNFPLINHRQRKGAVSYHTFLFLAAAGSSIDSNLSCTNLLLPFRYPTS